MCACVHFSSRTSLFTDRHGLATSPALTLSFILASVSLPGGFCTAELLSPRVFLTLYLFVYFSVMAHDWGFKKRRVTAFRVHDWLLRQHSLTTPNLQQNTVPGVLSSGCKKKEEKKKKKEKRKDSTNFSLTSSVNKFRLIVLRGNNKLVFISCN